MASPCEVFIDTIEESLACMLFQIAFNEALRIEKKFSRYRDDNIIYKINHSNGKSIKVDSETALMFDFATQCYDISEGLFDITSGVLRQVWKFDGTDNIPSGPEVNKLLSKIGWDKVLWDSPTLNLPSGMEIDLGGIGKEYAVDRTLSILSTHTNSSLLVNYGGDLNINKPRKTGDPWRIGIENPNIPGNALQHLEITQGALTTSGDSQRFLVKDGKRYSHVLNPKTGWPVEGAPRSVTVAAGSCTEAGIISTLALLNGECAEEFLDAQNVKYWCHR